MGKNIERKEKNEKISTIVRDLNQWPCQMLHNMEALHVHQ